MTENGVYIYRCFYLPWLLAADRFKYFIFLCLFTSFSRNIILRFYVRGHISLHRGLLPLHIWHITTLDLTIFLSLGTTIFLNLPAKRKNGQFSLAYVKSNFQSLVKDMPEFTSQGLSYSKYGFCFYLSSVIFILLAGAILYRIGKDVYVKIMRKKMDAECDRIGIVIILMAILTHIFLVLMHGSPGGYQFGARYIADCVPAAMLCILLCGKEFAERFKVPAAMLLIYGVVLNYIGAISVIV